MNNKSVMYTIFVLIVAFLILLTGCRYGDNNGIIDDCTENHTYTLKRGIAHFSFEYPSCYKVELVEIREDLGYTSIDICGPRMELEEGGMDLTFISLLIEIKSEEVQNAKYVLESDLTFFSGLLEEFKLLERSSITVVGISGEQLIYYYDRGPYQDDTDIKTLPTINREIYFDYNGLIWNLAIITNETAVEEANIIFDHIIETFKILD